MKKYFLFMILSAGSVLAKDTVSSTSVLPEKVLKLGEDQQKLITFLRKSKMLKGSKKQKQDILFLVLSQMKNSNFEQVCGSLGIRLKGKKARITVANRKKFLNFFKKDNTADVQRAYSTLAQSYLKSSGASSSVSGVISCEKEVEALLKQGKFEEALTQAKKQDTPHHSEAELPQAPVVWGGVESKISSGTPQPLVTYYLPYTPSIKDFQEVLAAAQQADASLISNTSLRSQFEKKLLNSADKMENESLNHQVEDVLQARRRVEQIQADLGTRTADLGIARRDLGLRTAELGTANGILTGVGTDLGAALGLAGAPAPADFMTRLGTLTAARDTAQLSLVTANATLSDIRNAFTTAAVPVPADFSAAVASLLTWQRTLRRDLTDLATAARAKSRRSATMRRADLDTALNDLATRPL